MMLGTPASNHHNTSNNNNKAAANAETEFEKQARLQVEREMAEEKHFATLKQYLNTAIGDFSRVLAPLVENEDKIKELPTLLHRASCYLFEGDLEKAEEDIVFVRRNLEAFKEAQEESPNSTSPTSYVAVKNAYQLILVRLENAKARRRHALPISPFALGGANSLMAAVQKFEAQQMTLNAAQQQMQQQQMQQVQALMVRVVTMLLQRLEVACQEINLPEVKAILMEAVDGFDPKEEVSDPLWEFYQDSAAEQDVDQSSKPVNTKVTPLFRE